MELDEDDPDLVMFSTFCQKVGKSDSHFLEGFLAELTGGGYEPNLPRGGSPEGRPSARKAPLTFYISPKNFQRKQQASRSPRKKEIQVSATPRKSKPRASLLDLQIDQVQVAKRYCTRQREACESLRLLIFGSVGNEMYKEAQKGKIFEQHRGSIEDVGKLEKVWSQMDLDHSGDIDHTEFMEYFQKSNMDRLLCMRCVKYLLSHASRGGHRGSLVKVTREDMMRLIWLKATPWDIAIMIQMFDFHRYLYARVTDPPRLPKKKRRQLLENFIYLDKLHTGVISFFDLVSGGLVDEFMMSELQSHYDLSGRGILSQDVFLEMLCPYGFRAHERVRRVVTEDGSTIVKVEVDCTSFNIDHDVPDLITGWILESDLGRFKTETDLTIRLEEAPAAEHSGLLS